MLSNPPKPTPLVGGREKVAIGVIEKDAEVSLQPRIRDLVSQPLVVLIIYSLQSSKYLVWELPETCINNWNVYAFHNRCKYGQGLLLYTDLLPHPVELLMTFLLKTNAFKNRHCTITNKQFTQIIYCLIICSQWIYPLRGWRWSCYSFQYWWGGGGTTFGGKNNTQASL